MVYFRVSRCITGEGCYDLNIEIKGISEGGKKMNAIEDPRIGKYISITGVIHTSASCGGKRGKFGTSKASGPITEEDIVYWGKIEHKFCARCN